MNKRSTTATKRELETAEAQPRAAAGVRLAFLVWDVSRLWRVVLDRALKPLGVTRSQYLLIGVLARRDGVTQTELAAELELTKVAVGGLLERMEAAGLVERRADKSDARLRRVYLTRKGARITDRIRELSDPIDAHMLAPVDDADLETTLQTLATIRRRLTED